MKYVLATIFFVAWVTGWPQLSLAAQQAVPDPLASPRWGDVGRIFLADSPAIFDPGFQVISPVIAERPMLVTVIIDAAPLATGGSDAWQKRRDEMGERLRSEAANAGQICLLGLVPDNGIEAEGDGNIGHAFRARIAS